MHPLYPTLRTALFCLGGLALLARAQTVTEPGRYSAETLFNGNGTTSVQFDPDGRMLYCEKQGRVLVALPDGRGGFSAPVEFADLRSQVFATGESGLLGLALDPDYRNTRHLFLFHTTAADQRLVRLTARPDFRSAPAGAPTVILAGLPRNAAHHKAGDIHIRPSDPDHVFIALGDDDQMNATQDPDLYAGKILRVHKATGLGAADNPFHAGDLAAIRSRVWAMGFRNPFRMVLHPAHPDILYVSENGGPANSRAREDRVAWVKKGANCAWNAAAYAAGASSPWFNPPDTKCKVLATDQPSLVGIALAVAGPFASPAGAGNAVLLVSNLGFPNLGGYASTGSIRRWRLTGEEWDRVEAISADGEARFVTGMHGADLEFGPDGHLYASSTHGEGATGGWYVFRRIRHAAGSTAVAPLRNRKVTQGGRWSLATRPGILVYRDLRGRRVAIAP